MAKTKRGLSEAEHAERRARDRERLRQAARELLTSDGWQHWVRARALFTNYSLRKSCVVLNAAAAHALWRPVAMPEEFAYSRSTVHSGRVQVIACGPRERH